MSKSTAGFTKAAQAAKFVRNRDIQLKDKELRKEAKISKESAEGVCKRCREKAQWRFKYDKYKPLKSRGNCQCCKQKTIVKAYRTFCDACAVKRKCCPGCTTPNDVSQAMEAEIESTQKKNVADEDEEEGEEEDEMDAEDSDGGGEVKYTINTKKGPVTVFNKATVSAAAAAPSSDAQDAEMDEDDEEDDDGDYEDCDDDEEADEEEEAAESTTEAGNTATKGKAAKEISEYQQALNNAEADLNTEVKMMDMAWDERKFTNMAASKYSKNRVVGAENDSHYFAPK